MPHFHIDCPKEFSYQLALEFLLRSPHERLHRVDGDRVSKLLAIGNENVLFSIIPHDGRLQIETSGSVNDELKAKITNYVVAWFDLETNLKPFYKMAKEDSLLAPLVKKFYGYRIIGQPDLFESLVWAVLGQQINLSFAYTLKQRFVETYGQSLRQGEVLHHMFPRIEVVAALKPEQLLLLQFSRQKAEYTIGIAQAFLDGRISRDRLEGMTFDEAKEDLMRIKGIGNWTANYSLMKSFRYPNAFPLEDAGLHNAIKNQLGLKKKPSLDRVKKIFKKYSGWEAYATLYLWKSL